MALLDSNIETLDTYKETSNLDQYTTTVAVSYVEDAEYLIAINGEHIGADGSLALGVPTTTGVTWTLIPSAELIYTQGGMRVYHGVATATGSETTVIDFPDTQRNCNVGIVGISSVDSIQSVTTNTTITTKTGSVTLPAISAGNMAIAFYGSESSGIWSADVGDTALLDTVNRVSIFGSYNLILDNVMTATYTDIDTSDYILTIGFELVAVSDTVIAEAFTVETVFTDVNFLFNKSSEAANKWFNGNWWPDPFFGADWWEPTTAYSINADTFTIDVAFTDVTFTQNQLETVMVADAFAITIDFIDAALYTPFEVDSFAVTTTFTDVDFSFSSLPEAFIISNDTTFDGKSIIYGVDTAYNSSTDIGYTVLSRVDVDSLLLDGIFGTPPQPYEIRKYIGEITTPTRTVLEFDGSEWKIESQIPFGI